MHPLMNSPSPRWGLQKPSCLCKSRVVHLPMVAEYDNTVQLSAIPNEEAKMNRLQRSQTKMSQRFRGVMSVEIFCFRNTHWMSQHDSWYHKMVCSCSVCLLILSLRTANLRMSHSQFLWPLPVRNLLQLAIDNTRSLSRHVQTIHHSFQLPLKSPVMT